MLIMCFGMKRSKDLKWFVPRSLYAMLHTDIECASFASRWMKDIIGWIVLSVSGIIRQSRARAS